MAGANDNPKGPRKVRDGLSKDWPVDHSDVTSDEALLRIAEARNSASKSANTFMIFAAIGAFLYFLRLQGVASQIKIGEYSLDKLPFGLFILSCVSLSLSVVSFIRYGDSRSYDRYLKLSCEKRFGLDCHLRYLAFPNDHAWGEPFSRMAHSVQLGIVPRIFRQISLLFISMFLFTLTVLPLMVGADFIYNDRWWFEADFRLAQSVTVKFLGLANLATLLLVSWIRVADRD